MTDSKKLDLILEKVTALDERMDAFETQMYSFNERMNAFDTQLHSLNERMKSFDTQLHTLNERMDAFDTQLHSLNERMDAFETDLHELRQHVNNIDLIIENEIRVNIQRVAEGHLDLSRLLHDAARPNNEVEMLSIRVSRLESDVKRLKEKVS